jgi:hypothetical protein
MKPTLRLLRAVSWTLLAAAAAGAAEGAAAELWKESFPLAAGNEWRYEGKMTVPNTGVYEFFDLPIAVTMTVTEEKHWGNVSLFILEGYPDDAAWALDGATVEAGVEIHPSRYGLLCVANKIFRIDESNLEDLMIAMGEGGYVDARFFAGDGPLFEFPLYVGARFGDPEQLPRVNPSYFWYGLEAAPFQGGKTEYHLVYNTGPDTADVWFVPGVGITRYKYNHHGTPMTVDLELAGATMK